MVWTGTLCDFCVLFLDRFCDAMSSSSYRSHHFRCDNNMYADSTTDENVSMFVFLSLSL